MTFPNFYYFLNINKCIFLSTFLITQMGDEEPFGIH